MFYPPKTTHFDSICPFTAVLHEYIRTGMGKFHKNRRKKTDDVVFRMHKKTLTKGA